ncbi:MAG TPA: hypothetical protein DCM67_08250 [Propionibacteriaceae bacterium]|nr:hypothetical protein [Propionibacteriaceae bacterium]
MQNGSTPEQEAQHMMEHNHIGAWMNEIRRNKAMTLVVNKATVTDANGATVDISVPEAAAPEAEDAEAGE